MEDAMNIVIHRSHEHAEPRLKAFAKGLEKHGLKPKWGGTDTPKNCDLAVMWSHNHGRVIEAQRDAGADYLVMECGYVGDRYEYNSLGFNGLNGRADFLNGDVPGDRWAAHADLMRPWRKGGDYIVIMGQVPGDAALAGMDVGRWVGGVAKTLRARYSLPVYFRPHPNAGQDGPSDVLTGSLADCLERARLVVTFNSNAGVDAVLAGVTTVAMDQGSMAWNVALHEPLLASHHPDRTGWAHRLAYCQWTQAELADGTAWAHLSRNFD